jgi:hypothetical protein
MMTLWTLLSMLVSAKMLSIHRPLETKLTAAEIVPMRLSTFWTLRPQPLLPRLGPSRHDLPMNRVNLLHIYARRVVVVYPTYHLHHHQQMLLRSVPEQLSAVKTILPHSPTNPGLTTEMTNLVLPPAVIHCFL